MSENTLAPNYATSFRPCARRTPAPVEARNMVGKFLDPESGVRIRFVSDGDPFPVGTQASEMLAFLRHRGVRSFFLNGGTMRLLGQYLREGLCERVEV